MTASDIVTVTVKVAALKIEITNVEFSAVSPTTSPSQYVQAVEGER